MMEVEEERDRDKEAESLREAEAAVEGLWEFSTRYLERRGAKGAASKWEDIKQRMEATLQLLEKQKDHLPKARYWYLKGKTLNVVPEHNPEVERCLSQAIKHAPELVDTWNQLGESYWKGGQAQQAHDCFAGALTQCKNKESLRNISMLLRYMCKDSGTREKSVEESVERAKEAVAMDVKDGISWMVLGNAYLSMYFIVRQDSKLLKQAVSAYTQAEKDPLAAFNPDLHFNKATLSYYEERYGDALRDLGLAAELDPGWSTVHKRMEEIVEFMESMTQLAANKGRLKAKKLNAVLLMLQPLLDRPNADKTPVNLSSCGEGLNSGKVFIGALVGQLFVKDGIPCASVLVDSEGSCVGVTVYNLAKDTSFCVGDTVAISDPLLSHIHLQEKKVDYWNIRVTDPSALLVNGLKLPASKLAPSTVSFSSRV